MTRTRAAFELKLQKASKTTDLRIPASVCTMFNVLVDARKQSAKLCALDGGQEVSEPCDMWICSMGYWRLLPEVSGLFRFRDKVLQ